MNPTKEELNNFSSHIFHLRKELKGLLKLMDKLDMRNINEIQCASCKDYFDDNIMMHLSPIGWLCIDCHKR